MFFILLFLQSHSQSNYYYNNENDALSCNSRPISSTLHRESSNEQYKNNVDIHNYSNTNNYDIINGTRESMDIVEQRKFYEPGSDVYVDSKDVNRECENTYRCDIDVLLQRGVTTSTKSSTYMTVQSDYSNGGGYSINDNLNDQNQIYNSYTNGMCKNEGVGNSRFCYNTPLSTISGDNTAEYDHETIGYSTGYISWENTLHNDDYIWGRQKSIRSTKVLPRIPINQSSSLNEYEDMKMQAPFYDADTPFTTSSILPLQTMGTVRMSYCDNHVRANEIPNKLYARADACSTSDNTVSENIGGAKDSESSGLASLRLLSQLHLNQEYENVYHRKILDDDNRRTMVISSTETTTTTSTNICMDTYENTTIIKNDGHIYEDTYNSRNTSEVTTYDESLLQRPYASMAPQCYMEYDGYNISYNNAYSNSYAADKLTSYSDMAAYSEVTAQKLLLQQQRRYAIMMAMTTASVIASGETRVPVKRFNGCDVKSHTESVTVAKDDILALKAQALGGYDFLSNEEDSSSSSLWVQTNEGLSSRKGQVATKSAMVSTITTSATNNFFRSSSSSAITHLTMKTPTTLTLTTSTRKLPKRLPTPKPKSNNNNSNCHDKVNGSSKKLPKLPIENETLTADNLNIVMSQVVNMSETSALPTIINITEISQVKSTNAIAAINTFPSLRIDTFRASKSTTCVESISSSTSPTSSSAIITSYSPSYTPYLSNVTATKATTNANVVTDFSKTINSGEHLTTIQTPTTATTSEVFANSKINSYDSSYNNNNTCGKYDFVKENSINFNNNNSVILSPTSTECKLSVTTTTISTNTISPLSEEQPLYVEQLPNYSSNMSNGSGNIDDIITVKRSSICANIYDNFLQTTSSTSSNSPPSSPSIKKTPYVCSTVTKPKLLVTSDTIKTTTEHCSSDISPISVTTLTLLVTTSSSSSTTTTPTTNKSVIFSAYSNDKINSIKCNVKPSYSLSTDVGLKDSIAMSTDENTLVAADTYNLNAKVIFDTTMSKIYDEYLKNASECYLISTATTLSTLTTAATDTSLSVTSCIPSSTSIAVETTCDTLDIQPFTSNTVDKISVTPTKATSPVSLSQFNVKNASKLKKLLPTTLTTTPFIGHDVTWSENFLQNDSHGIITTTSSIVTTLPNNVGRLLTTTVELTNKALSTTTSNTISIADTTSPKTYADYLAKYQLPTVLMINGSSSNNNNIGDLELPLYIKEFLNCDTNISDSHSSKYDEMLHTFDSFNACTLPTIDVSTTPNAKFTPLSEASVETVMTTTSAPEENKYDCTILDYVSEKYAVHSDIFPLTTSKTTTTTTTTIYSDDSITFSYSSMAPILNHSFGAVITTAIPASVQVPSLTSAFDDSFYDSYNVDWSSLAASTTIEKTNAEPIAISTKTDSSSANRIVYKDDTKIQKNADSSTRKSTPSAVTTLTAAETTSLPPALSVAGKATSMFGGISKGLKGGLDGVLSSVNTTATTSDSDSKQPKKSGFGFALASKFVPNVGGLFASTTAPVQQTSGVLQSTNRSINAISTIATITTTTTILNTDTLMEGCRRSKSNYGFYGNTTATTTIYGTEGQQYSCAVISKYNEPLYTNCHGDNMVFPYDMRENASHSRQMHVQSDDMMLAALKMMSENVGNNCNNDDIVYIPHEIHPQLQSNVVVTSDIKKTDLNSYVYEIGYDDADVARVVAVNNKHSNTTYNKYAADLQQDKHDMDDMQNVSYAKQVNDGRHVGVVDGSMINTTACLNNDMTTRYYQPQQQINSQHMPHQQQEQQEGLNNTGLHNTSSLAKKASSSLLPAISTFTAHVNIQRPSTSSASSTNSMSPLTVKAVKPSAGMFGSLLGKAAAAVQSATQVINQATITVQQKAATVILPSATETAVTTATKISTTAAPTTNQQQKLLSNQNSISSSHYSTTAANVEDYDNRNLYNYKNNVLTTEVPVTKNNSMIVTNAATLHYTDYYLYGNQRQLQKQQQQNCVLLPSVPTAGSTGKKLPTINSNKSGFLIKQQPTEIYDDDLITDIVNDTSEHLLIDDEEIFDELNDNNLSNIDDDDNELDRYTVDERIGQELIDRQQNLRQIQLYDNDSEQANYYTDSQLQETPSDSQQKLSQNHQRRLAANSYYEHTNGGYDYREDYFNEEDEYKYLEKEQEILFQQQQQNLLKQKKQQKYQYEDSSDIYMEDNYQSEDSGNYLEESSSSSVVGGAANALASKQQSIQIVDTPISGENDELVKDFNTLPTVPTTDNSSGMANGNAAALSSSSHQHHIKKQESIIMEEDEDDILLNDIGVNNTVLCKEQQSHSRRSSHESIIAIENDDMCELPSIPVIAPKKKILIRGETEEVVSGQLLMIRKSEVTAKQRWHWAYNKIIMQLNVSTIINRRN